ncbi:hypothetical protein L2E82_12519 [Cichorium intybus]|uniref:Uncharacterized protein n=1 Tax=Cichorium intybus TaxID=13427 RepID=A0ACB9GI97_CICIN|nr:hypothetical protein L2E82_12519 [Cichorium intybus]
MFEWVEKIVHKFWQPLGKYVRMHRREDENASNGHWSKALEPHAFGEYSYAVVQANQNMEDFSQVEVGMNGTFVGVYDGHGGNEAAWFVCRYLFENFIHDHNVNLEHVRRQLQLDHPDDLDVVVRDEQGVWRVKGIIQISRAIGDLYLKRPEFAKGHLNQPLRECVLRSDPVLQTRDIEPTDRFIIFASDGLWEHLANQEAVDIVRKSTDRLAKKLIKKALKVAAKKQHRSYRSVRRLAPGLRRPVHDDISVIVLFIDHNLMERSAQVEEVSVKAFAETTESEFKYIYGGASTSAGGPSTSAAGPRTSAVGASTSAVGASASADDGASTSGPKASTSAGGKNTADDGSSSSSE